ncbi:MAG: HPr family phosphocarrier protein [Clostridia bacterium]|nr:HPr family phosphocarrier protein [Clostridia bacterium]
MESFTHVLRDAAGLHARPAGKFAKEAAAFESNVTVHTETGTADGKRLLALMRLAVKQGMVLTVVCDGADEAAAAAHLRRFMEETL